MERDRLKLLLTGATGLIGQAILASVERHIEVIPTTHETGMDGRETLDLDLKDSESVGAAVREARPDWILYAAAISSVDDCERDPALARAVNAEGTRRIAEAARHTSTRVLYLSTGYVFDGEDGPYSERDQPSLVNVYGETKLEGERLVSEILPDPLVVRTSLVYGQARETFITWCARQLAAGHPVDAIVDQTITPISAGQLAEQIVTLLKAGEQRTFHAAGAETMSRFEAAVRIANEVGAPENLVKRCTRAQMDWTATRPERAGLQTDKIRRYARPRTLEEGLSAVLGPSSPQATPGS